ncbi:hypothetical protein ACJX0J_039839 [Zea mays]
MHHMYAIIYIATTLVLAHTKYLPVRNNIDKDTHIGVYCVQLVIFILCAPNILNITKYFIQNIYLCKYSRKYFIQNIYLICTKGKKMMMLDGFGIKREKTKDDRK